MGLVVSGVGQDQVAQGTDSQFEGGISRVPAAVVRRRNLLKTLYGIAKCLRLYQKQIQRVFISGQLEHQILAPRAEVTVHFI